MKTKFLIATLLLAVAGMQSVWAQTVTLYIDGQPFEYSIEALDSISFSERPIIVDGHEFVDLELPSGTLWATTNIGADKPEDYGTYFAWAETEPKEEYSWDTYPFYRRSESQEWFTKYDTDDGKTELEAEDDAATAVWGALWQTPLYNQLAELIDPLYTTTEWTTLNDVNGWRITSKQNGQSIFLPAAGTYNYKTISNQGSQGCYWSRSLFTSYYLGVFAYSLNFKRNNFSFDRTLRYYGQNIRPIRVPLKPYDWPVKSIDLDKTEIELGRNTTDMLTATVLPTYAKNTSVAWESSDEGIAVVNEEGRIRATGVGTCSIICRSTDGTDVLAECQVTVIDQGETDEHEWVDLGLPSGTLWATTNVGADTPEGFGDYFAWGETNPNKKNTYNWNTYQWTKSSIQGITKYTIPDGNTDADWYKNGVFVGDGRTWLQPNDDAACRFWGNKWQLPSKEQFEELINEEYNTVETVTQNGTKGLKITSKTNSKSIFLPAAGYYREPGELEFGNNYGIYWSRSLSGSYSHFAYRLFFTFSIGVNDIYRYYGMTVRPVRNQEFIYLNRIELDETQLFLEPNQQIQLTATLTPNNADNPSIKWMSSNPSVASVSQDGTVTAGANGGACTITCLAADGGGAKADCKIAVVGEICPDNNHPHAIDLGLPSGTKWCCSDVSLYRYNPYEYNDCFYAWGETETKTEYSQTTWRLYNPNTHEYADMGEELVGTNQDVARIMMGAPWHTPTREQMQELADYCSAVWMYKGEDYFYRVYGVIVTGPNNKQIFLPANGFMWLDTNNFQDNRCVYWSATAHPNNNGEVYVLTYDSNYPDRGLMVTTYYGYEGLCFRAVQ